MSESFCCPSIQPYRPQKLDHEHKFSDFVRWAKTTLPASKSQPSDAPFSIQLVRQVNFGPIESIRYFVPVEHGDFEEVSEDWLLSANFEKVNSFKNFRCAQHNRFFEVNLYERNAVNRHHWRSNIARPFRQIDHIFRHGHSASTSASRTGTGTGTGVPNTSHRPELPSFLQSGDPDSDSSSSSSSGSDQQDPDSSLPPAETEATSFDSSDGPELSFPTLETEAAKFDSSDEATTVAGLFQDGPDDDMASTRFVTEDGYELSPRNGHFDTEDYGYYFSGGYSDDYASYDSDDCRELPTCSNSCDWCGECYF